MKKLAFIAIAAIVALGFASCNKQGAAGALKNDVDSLSYAMGMQQSNGLDMYLDQLGIDSTMHNDFYRGLKKAFKEAGNKKDLAYNMGIMIGTQLGDQMFKRINDNFFPGDSVNGLNKKKFLEGFVAAAKGGETLLNSEQAMTCVQVTGEAVRQKTMERIYSENRQKGEAFLAEYAAQEGVNKTESGVLYKVIEAGAGETFADSVQVLVNYEGKLIDGTVFDSSYNRNQPATMVARGTIAGFQEVLTQMPKGAKWEVVIPQQLAYGARDMGNIKPFSTLIFTIEMVGLKENK